MTFLDMLRAAERQNGSMLCVGLDPEPTKFPDRYKGDANKIYDFCARIVDATADLVSSFKPQIAYFAAHRAEGQLERLMEHMRRVAPHVPIILDAKRGDIGSTAEQYAKEAFERYGADAVTLSPFMGWDSVAPYLKYEGKGAFLLCRTSNPGGDDLQNQRLASVEGQPRLYEHVAKLAQGPWNLNGQLGLVVGSPCLFRVWAHKAATPWPPSRPAGVLMPMAPALGPSSLIRRVRCSMHRAGKTLNKLRGAWPCRRGTRWKRPRPAEVRASLGALKCIDAALR
jgi:orotidine 5'-phosphate decarboxylase subfamily 2